jgi:hypothetical protein
MLALLFGCELLREGDVDFCVDNAFDGLLVDGAAFSDSSSSSTTTVSSTVLSDQSTPLSFPNSYIDRTRDDNSVSSRVSTRDCRAARLVRDPLSGLKLPDRIDAVRGVAVPFAIILPAEANCAAFLPSSNMLPLLLNCILSSFRSSNPPVGIAIVMPLNSTPFPVSVLS